MRHLPFTGFGAALGIVLFFLLKDIPKSISFKIFYVLHPAHVLFSAIVTTSLYKFHRYDGRKVNYPVLFLVGYVGAIGVATLSDSLIPYFGEVLLNFPHREAHLGFIEKWWLVNPLAFLGIVIAIYKPRTKIPHAGHVLLSTHASIFHIIMSLGISISLGAYLGVFIFLFFSILVPCCLSDIIFPVTLAGLQNNDQ